MSQLLDRIAALPPEKRAALLEMLRPVSEPIAIVGMGCRFAGADSPAAFWQLLKNGRDMVTEIPPRRWDLNAYYDPDPNAAGKVATRWGTFVDGADEFDAHFFGIGPHEAARMDPHQRLLLEVTWEALEHGGINPRSLAGTATGVFIGAYHSDYSQLALSDTDGLDLYSGTGTANNVLAGRLSYFLDVRGPSIVIDTACSSGLVAVQLACQSLRHGECEMAIAGGITLLLTPLSFMMASRMGLMARDGRCKTFDARADGIVMGDGCGAVALKRLSTAQAAGDRILALIRGAAVNQDGRTNGLTAPNVISQQALLRAALRDGNVDARSVTCIEAHGTGTPLGDPIEVEALTEVIGVPRPDGTRCAIASVKTNIGHTGAAAGMAGLIKTVLSLQHRTIPPACNFKALNPGISFEGTPFYIPLKTEPWHAGASPRRAGVSAFGWSGTNAHLVLEEAPSQEKAPAEPPSRHLLLLSAKRAAGLEALAGRYQRHLAANPALSLTNVCATAAAGRAHFSHRLAVEGSSLAELQDTLDAFRAGARSPHLRTGEAKDRPVSAAFLFTGQGSQYAGMAKKLYEAGGIFRRELARCDQILEPLIGRSIVEVMHGESATDMLEDTALVQPALVALEWSLASQWRAWGVMPAAVIGHSVGEIAAAAVADVFDIEDALILAASRGKLVSCLPRGGMAAVFASESDVRSTVERHGVGVAALNGPAEVVVAGDLNALAGALADFTRAGIRSRSLSVSHAFHSQMMDPVLEELERVAAALGLRRPRIPFISSIAGLPTDECDPASAKYWRRQLRETVRFEQGLHALAARGLDVLIEIGPASVLCGIARRCLGRSVSLSLSSLDPQKDDRSQMLGSAGAWYAFGGDLNYDALEADNRPLKIELPTYAFQRDRYPIPEASKPGVPAMRAYTPARVRSPFIDGDVCEFRLSAQLAPYLEDHRVYGNQVLPMTGYVALAFAAGAEALADVSIEEPMVFSQMPFDKDEERVAQVILRPREKRLEIFSRSGTGDQWTRHFTARLSRSEESAWGTTRTAIGPLVERCGSAIAAEDFYKWLADQGLEYGPCFRGVRAIWRGDGEAIGRVELPGSLAQEASEYRAHPALLDACDQVFAAALPGALTSNSDLYLPLRIEYVSIASSMPSRLWSHCRVRPATGELAEAVVADLRMFDENGGAVAEIRGLLLKRAPRSVFSSQTRQGNPLHYAIEWEAAPPPRLKRISGAWLVTGDGRGAAERLVRRFEDHGCTAKVSLQVVTANEPIAGVVLLPQMSDDGCTAALDFMQAAVERVGSGKTDVWLVTRGAQAVGPPPHTIVPHQAQVWGLGRTAALEYPDLRVRLVDLDPNTDELDPLVEEIFSDAEEPEVAIRAGQRFVPRLEPVAVRNPANARWKADATYLVTGGFSGLGLRTALWLAAQGARNIALIGRSTISAEANREIGAMERAGIRVAAVQTDVSNYDLLAHALNRIRGTMPPLAGIFHCAGVLDDGIFPHQTHAKFARTMAPKVAGTLHLHSLTRDLPLDHFVLFSSIAGCFGAPAQAGYAAANAFLDAFAHYRRSLGLPALSINWGAWSETGMAARLSDGRRLQLSARGLNEISPAHAFESLSRAIGDQRPQVVIAAIEWPAFIAQFDKLPPLFSHIARTHQPRTRVITERKPEWRQRISDCAAGERFQLLCALLSAEAANAIGLETDRVIEPDQSLYEYGLTSLRALDLARAIGQGSGRELSPNALFNYSTVEALAGYLAREFFEQQFQGISATPDNSRRSLSATTSAAAMGAESGTPQIGILRKIEELSDDEVDRLLEAKARR